MIPTMHPFFASSTARIQSVILTLQRLRWRAMAVHLRDRVVADQLPLTASSLTFTTIIALVPLITVLLAVFTVFPMFGKLQTVLQQWLIESLVPDNIAKQVLGYLTQFSGKASRLGGISLVVLFGTALALILTIDRTLNRLWRVQRPRPLRQRVLIYWAVLTLGPLLLGVILTITSYLVTASKTVVGAPPEGFRLLLNLLELVLLAGGLAALFRSVPNTLVKWSHAWLGGAMVALAFEAAKKLLTLYLSAMPTYSAVYGAFATVPILLIWVYLAWLIVLCGAVIVASLPGWLAGELRSSNAPAWHFQLALETLALLDRSPGSDSLALNATATAHDLPAASVANSTPIGMTQAQLCSQLQVDPLQLGPVLQGLLQLDWIGQLDEMQPQQDARFVLLVNLDSALQAPLVAQFLWTHSTRAHPVWEQGIVPTSPVRQLL